MADHEACYFSALLHAGQPGNLRGLTRDHFTPRYRPVWDWVINFLSSNHALPRPETVEGQFPGLNLSQAPEDVSFYASRVRENAMRVALEDGLTAEVVQPLEQSRAADALAGVKKVMADVSRTFREPEKGLILDLETNVAARLADYELRSRAGDSLGMPLPWRSLTMATGGIQASEVWAVLARPNVGKTWALVVFAVFLWQLGYRVLFASMEVPPQSGLPRDKRHRIIRGFCIRCGVDRRVIAQADETCPAALTARQRLSIRFDAIGARLSAYRLLRGCLTPPEKRVLESYYEACADPERNVKYGWGDLRIVAAPAVATVTDLEVEAMDFQPDVILWDSAYLAAESFAKRTESTGHLVRDIKILAERSGVPIVISWHFNREVTEDSLEASMNDAALTDEVGRVCDVLVGLFQTREMKDAGEAIWRTLKVRDGLGMRELRTNFRVKEEVNFAEIAVVEQASGGRR